MTPVEVIVVGMLALLLGVAEAARRVAHRAAVTAARDQALLSERLGRLETTVRGGNSSGIIHEIAKLREWRHRIDGDMKVLNRLQLDLHELRKRDGP